MQSASGPALLFTATDLDPAQEEAVNRWYDGRHVPQRQALPGFLSARRFVAYEGGPKYAALYDLDSASAMQSDAYKALSSPAVQTDEDRAMLGRFQNTLRSVMVQILHAGATTPPAPDQAGGLLAVGLEPEAAYEEEYNAWYDEEHIPGIMKVAGVLRARRFRAVDDAGSPRYLSLYDLSSPQIRHSTPFEQAIDTPWSTRMRNHCTRRITAIYRPLAARTEAAATR